VTWEILTPDNRTAATELSGEKRPRFRKQIMKLETINYKDRFGTRRISFDRPYLQDLVRSFKNGAFPQVPFQLADGANSHNNDPERTRGELVDVELTADGIDGIFETSDRGAALVRENPRLGVSCRILEPIERSDGQTFPRAIQHVLGTVHPQLIGMRPWEQISLSHEDAESLLDLSNQVQEDAMPDTDTVTVELPREQAERLSRLLEDMEASDELAALMDTDEDEPDQEQEDGEGTGDDNEETGDAVNTDLSYADLSGNDQFQAMQVSLETANQRIVELATQARTAELRGELDGLRRQGLAPAVLRAAQPLLELPVGAVELSAPDGSRTDPAEVLRQVLQTVIDLSNQGLVVVDLGAESGFARPDDDPAASARDELVKAWADQY
jgi:hypothetical protein